jgi:predicted outer membrane repeat protein
MLKRLIFIANFILPFCAAAAFSDVINDFYDLQNAVQNSPADIEIRANSITFLSNLFQTPASSVYFDFKSASTAQTSVLDGSYIYKGIAVKNNSRLSFENIVFRSMNSQNGGAVYVENSSASFSETISFEKNHAYSGGALYAQNSRLLFEGETNFSHNSADNMGGAFELNSSSVYFSSSVGIAKNSALYSGGGFMAFNNSLVVFDSESDISENSSLNGGGFMVSGSTIRFTASSKSVFSDNKAMQSGGAFDSRNSRVSFEGISEFSENSAFENGGAFAASGKSSVVFSAAAAFYANSANLGGAVYINDSKAFFTNAKFDSNSAGLDGGAIYAVGGYLQIRAENGGKSVFKNNTAGGISNAITLKEGTIADFYAEAGSSIEMLDAIRASQNSVINFSGEGDFNLYAALNENEASLKMSFSNGGAFNVKDGGGFRAGLITNDADSKINMINAKTDFARVNELNNAGTLSFDAGSGAFDKMRVEGDVNLDASSSLLQARVNLVDTEFRKITYKLINYGGSVNGTFSAADVINGLSFSNLPSINYGDVFSGWITLTLYGDKTSASFSAMKDLGFNRYQTAKALDAVSQNAQGDADAVISFIEGFGENEVRNALLESSGYFLANAVRSAAADSDASFIFSRIDSDASIKPNDKFWTQYGNANAQFFSDKESPRDYNYSSNAVAAGYDAWLERDITGGIFVKRVSRFAKQGGANSADILNAVIGFYGGYVIGNWQIKTLLSGSFDRYSTQRRIEFADRTAEADFGGSSFYADVEGARKYNIGRETMLKPFAGISAANTAYRSFKETGAQSLGLSVRRGSYFRSVMRFGAQIEQESSYFKWHLKGGGAALLSGKYPEIESTFLNEEPVFLSRGSEESIFSFEFSAGAGISISKALQLFASTDFNASSQSSFFNIALGLSYGFYSNTQK